MQVNGAPVRMDTAVGRPAVHLKPLVARYIGYRYEGFQPGTHLGLPSRHLTVVISLGEPLRLAMPGADEPSRTFDAVASGLSAQAVTISHDGNQYGVQLELNPLGSRTLLHLPASELATTAVNLDSLIGPAADELTDRLASAAGWSERFAILDETLARRPGRIGRPSAELMHAWGRIMTCAGTIQIGDLAAEVGWSRRHLSAQFNREFGLTPKETARVARFERSRWLLQSATAPTLATVAALCGYYDQAHLAREWNDLAGCPPSAWLASEVFPSVQDESPGSAAG